MYCDEKGKIHFINEDEIIVFDVEDLNKLSVKHFGDELTPKELDDLRRLCCPADWSKVDDGGWEGCLAHLLQAVIAIIGAVRVDRRGHESCSQ